PARDLRAPAQGGTMPVSEVNGKTAVGSGDAVGGIDSGNAFRVLSVDTAGRILLGASTASIGVVDTELPAAAALGDGASAAQTTPTVGAELLVTNFTTNTQL